MPALQRAVAFAQMHHVAVGVGEHLEFDMARPVKIPLKIDDITSERGVRFGAGDAQRLIQLAGGGGTFMPRPPPPAAALTSTG